MRLRLAVCEKPDGPEAVIWRVDVPAGVVAGIMVIIEPPQAVMKVQRPVRSIAMSSGRGRTSR